MRLDNYFKNLILNNVSDAIIIINHELKILTWNKGAEELYGWKSSEVIGKTLLNVIPMQNKGIINEIVRSNYWEGKVEQLKKNGTSIVVKSQFFQIKNNMGRNNGFLAINQEINRFEKADKNSKTVELLCYSFFESLSSAFIYNKIILDNNQCPVDFVILEVNHAFERLIGLKKKEIFNKPAKEVMSRIKINDLDWLEIFGKVALKSNSTQFESYIDSVEQWYQISVYSPKKEFFVVIFENINNQKLMELKIKKSEKKYRQIVENVQEGIWFIDKDGYTIYTNEQMALLLGYSLNEMEGMHIFEFMDDEGVKLAKKYLERRKQGIKEQHEFKFIKKSGDVIYASLKTSPIFSDNGKYVGAIALVSDITERRITYKYLKQSEKKFRMLFNSITDAIFIHDLNGKILEFNTEGLKRLGYSREELLQLTPMDIDSPPYREKVSEHIQEILEKGQLFFESEHTTRDSRIIPSEINARLIDYMGRKAILSVSRDITERKKIEEELRISEINLKKRVDELTCLFKISKLIGDKEISVHYFFEKIIQCILSKLNYHNRIGTRILYYEKIFQSKDLSDSNKYRLSSEIIVDGEYVGRLECFYLVNPANSDQIKFKESEQNLLDTISRMIGEFLGRKKAESAINRQNQEIMALYNASRNVLKHQNFEDSATMIYDSCQQLIGATFGNFLILLDEDQDNKIKFLKEWDEEHVNDSELDLFIRQSIDKVKEWKKAFFNNTFTITHSKNFLSKKIYAVQNVLVVPLIIDDDLRGIIFLVNKPGGFNESDLELVSAFADIASISLLNNQILDSLKKSENKYRTLSNELEDKVKERTKDLRKSKEKYRTLFEKLKESEEKFRTISDQSLVGIIIFQNNEIQYFNQCFLDLFGYNKFEFENRESKDYVKLFHLNYQKEIIKIFRSYQNTLTKTPLIQEYQAFKKDGSVFWLEIYTRSIIFNKKPAGMSFFIDITERKESENFIQEEVKKLKEVDVLKDNFIERASHELKTPLNSIISASTLLSNNYLDHIESRGKNLINIIKQGGQRLKSLIEQMLEISKFEANGLIFNLQQVNIVNLINKMTLEMYSLAFQRNLAINIDFRGASEIFLECDEIRIGQVIANLLSNAINNTPPYGKINIGALEYEDFIEIWVKDNGVGFTQSEKEKLFKKFGKIERSKKDFNVNINGTGLGLYISRQIIVLHKGEIWVESEGRNKGSIFKIRLPKKKCL